MKVVNKSRRDAFKTALTIGAAGMLGGNALANAAPGRQNQARLLSSGNTIVVKIPDDFPDLQSAVDHYLANTSASDICIELQIQSGHQLTKGVGVYNVNAAKFIITSQNDATVTLASKFVGVTDVAAGRINGDVKAPPLFYGLNADLPQINCLIDMAHQHGSGYFGVNSKGFVHPGCGVINAGSRGIQWRGGYIYAIESNFSGANDAGVRMHQSASGTIEFGNFNNCCSRSDTSNSDSGAIFVSRSCALNMRNATVTGSGRSGIVANRSIVTAPDVDVSYAAEFGLFADSCSSVDFINSQANSCGSFGIKSGHGSRVAAQSARILNGTGLSVQVTSGSEVIINAYTATTHNPSPTYVANDYDGVSYFNVPTGNGVVYLDSGAPLVETQTVAGVTTTRYADGRQEIIGEITLKRNLATPNTLLLAKMQFSQPFIDDNYNAQVTLPTVAESWFDPTDINKVSYAGYSKKYVGAVDVVCHSISGQTWSDDTEVANVSVLLTGRWY